MKKERVLSVVIPIFNEERTLQLLLEKVIHAHLPEGITRQLILVNDCSSDRSEEIVRDVQTAYPDVDIRYIGHATNQGKGAALHTGIREATGDFLIIQDADLEYDPNEYGLLLQPVLEDVADVVYGSRFVGGKPHRVMFYWHTRGNKWLTMLSNAFTNLNLTDMETCYKLFRMEVIKGLELREKRFGFEPEVTAKIARIKNLRIYEVGISYYGRSFEEGKKIGWRDGFRAIWCILKYNLIQRGRS
jgi:glycosyltransferase involved in cell wall biosynthesis